MAAIPTPHNLLTELGQVYLAVRIRRVHRDYDCKREAQSANSDIPSLFHERLIFSMQHFLPRPQILRYVHGEYNFACLLLF